MNIKIEDIKADALQLCIQISDSNLLTKSYHIVLDSNTELKSLYYTYHYRQTPRFLKEKNIILELHGYDYNSQTNDQDVLLDGHHYSEFDIIKMNAWIEEESEKLFRETALNFHFTWIDQAKGECQFGSVKFTQRGKKRKDVFVTAMNLYKETQDHKIVIKTLSELTGSKKAAIRTELYRISKKLKNKVGLYFKGSDNGYYTLEKFQP